MDSFYPETYGERVADVYDEWIRYAWPAELDLMAQLAGLRLREASFDSDRVSTGSGSDLVSVQHAICASNS
jgi:hypothetical protein